MSMEQLKRFGNFGSESTPPIPLWIVKSKVTARRGTAAADPSENV